MMSPDRPIEELDLLAYADGRLGADPRRRRQVEAWLREHPEARRRVGNWMANQRAIRERYAPVLEEEVPERLLAVVEGARARPWIRMRALAAMLGWLALGAGAGWWAAGGGGLAIPGPGESVEQALLDFRAPPAAGALPAGGAGAEMAGSGRLPIPVLDADGYRMEGAALVRGRREARVIDYRAADGHRLRLVVQTRWTGDDPPMEVETRDGLGVARWLDGPLAFGVVSEGGVEEAAAIAVRVHELLRQPATPGLDTARGPDEEMMAEEGGAAVGEGAVVTEPPAAGTVVPVKVQVN